MSLPPERFSGKNLRDIPAIIPTDGYAVYEWVPGDDGKGTPEQMHLGLRLSEEFDGAEIILRIKSKREADRLIAALTRCRDGIWKI